MNSSNRNTLSIILILGALILNTFIVIKFALGIFFLGFLMSGGVSRGIQIPLTLTLGIGMIPYILVFIPIYFLNKVHIKKIVIGATIVHLVECIIFSICFLNSLLNQI